MQKKHGPWRPLVWFLIVTTWLADITTNHKEVYSKINVFWVYFLSHWPPQLEASSYWNHRHGEPVNPQHNPRTLLASACPAYPAYPEEESIRILGGMVYSLRYDLSQPHDDKDPTIIISLTFCNSWLAMIRSTKHKPLLDLWLGLQMMPVKWYFSRKDKIGQVHDLFVQNWMKETDKVQKTKGGHRAFGSVGSWHPTSSGFNLVAWACCPGARTHDLAFVRCRNKIGEWVSENAGITRHVKLMGWCALPGLQSEVGFKPAPPQQVMEGFRFRSLQQDHLYSNKCLRWRCSVWLDKLWVTYSTIWCSYLGTDFCCYCHSSRKCWHTESHRPCDISASGQSVCLTEWLGLQDLVVMITRQQGLTCE